MRRTVVDLRFRDRLVTLMGERQVTAKALADAVPMARSYLSEIINGYKMPGDDIACALDNALNANGRLADLVAVASLADDLDPLAAAAANPHLHNPAALASLGRVLSAQRHLEDLVGAAAVIGPVATQLDVIASMVRSARGAHRPPVLTMAGQWAQYAGWLYMSLGKWPESQTWNSTALQWAVENADRELTATVLSYQAHLAELRLEWGATAGLARAAMRDETVYPGQRAYDAFQAARGHAVIGDVAEAERMMTVGDEIATQIDSWDGEVPPWQYYRDPWFWDLERGLVWRYIARWKPGTAELAVEHLRAGLEGMPAEWRGSDWAAEYRAYLVDAYIRAGATETAREELAEVRRAAEATSSRRVLQLVAVRERQLRVA